MIFDNAEESEDEERVIVAGGGAMLAGYSVRASMLAIR
jgi:hypothetical protein